jgi:hypothetical protein
MPSRKLLISMLLGLGTALIVTVILAAGPLPRARAATLTVTSTADSGSGSLREAIAAASAGDTINFSFVTYPATITLTSGQLTINDDLIIDGPGTDQLAISGNDASRVFYISGGEVTIEDLKVTQGTAPSFDPGGGICIVNSGTTVTLTRVNIVSNTAYVGGGISLESGSLAIEGAQIISNTATTGGGIHLESGEATLNEGEIRGNTADHAGGVYVGSDFDTATFTVTGDSIIGYNTAHYSGGGLYVDNGIAVLVSGQVISNTAEGSDIMSGDGGGGLYVSGNAVVTLNGGQIIDNTANNNGGGVYLYEGDLTLNGAHILSNTAERYGGGVYMTGMGPSFFTQTGTSVIAYNSADVGGGIHEDGGYNVALLGGQILSNTAQVAGGMQLEQSNALLSNMEIRGNTATDGDGGGVYITWGSPTISNCQIISNTAYDNGGGVYLRFGSVMLEEGQILNNTAVSGGGVFVYAGTATLNGTELRGNTSTGSWPGGGGGIYVGFGSLEITGGQIIENTADYGGGVCITQGSATVTLNGGQIISNTATSDGGGLCVMQGHATLNGGQIISNTAQYGGGVSIHENGSSVVLSGGEIRGNTASLWGGGVILGYDATFTQTDVSTITHNTATLGGGVYIHQGSAVFNGGQVIENTAEFGGGVYVALDNATVTLNGGQIISNTAQWDGGGMYVYSGTATLSGGLVASNTAQYGAGLQVYGGSTTLSGGEIRGNTATSWGGGVMVVYENATFTQTGTGAITYNSAQSGGGIHILLGNVTLDGGQIANNTTTDGSTLYNYSGAITQTNTVTISGNIYQENGTFSGGGDPLIIQGVLHVDGGTFTAPNADFQITNLFVHTGGTYRQTRSVTGSMDTGFPMDGGVIINANGQDLGDTTVVVRADTDCTATPGETVRRCYNITPTNTSNFSATITFYFLDTEVVSSNSCSTLNVYRWDGSDWITLTLDTYYGTGGRDCSAGLQSIRVKDVSEFSPFVLKSDGPPTAVTLASFTATPQAGGILLQWETAIEIDNVGFNLYRSTSPNGSYIQLNGPIIPSQAPGSVFGTTYTWLDEDVESGTMYYYKLEDIEVGGKHTFHGPIAAQPAGPTALVLRSLGTRNSLVATLLVLLGVCGLASVWWIRKRR